MSTPNDALAEMRRYQAERSKSLSLDDFDRCYYQGLVDMFEHMEHWYAAHPPVDTQHWKEGVYRTMLDALQYRIAASEAEVARLREAMSNLLSECCAILGIVEPDLRHIAGNTNVNCLKSRMDIARAALSQPQEPKP